VIVTTAYSDNANRLVGRLNFVRRYLVKPFTHRELFAAIDQVLELYKVEP
jgi:DNA-binding response OmpR family regulator